MPTHVTKIMVLGVFDPLNGRYINRTPKKAHPCMERCHMKYRSSKSAWPVHRPMRPKKKTKKETLQWQTGYLPRPPTWSDRNTV